MSSVGGESRRAEAVLGRIDHQNARLVRGEQPLVRKREGTGQATHIDAVHLVVVVLSQKHCGIEVAVLRGRNGVVGGEPGRPLRAPIDRHEVEIELLRHGPVEEDPVRARADRETLDEVGRDAWGHRPLPREKRLVPFRVVRAHRNHELLFVGESEDIG